MDNDESSIEYITFGTYNPTSMGVTLENMSQMEKSVTADIENMKLIVQSHPDHYNKLLIEHQKRFSFYYRVRAHEKSHWYTLISSSITIARLMADGDCQFHLNVGIKDFLSKTNSNVLIPLGKWAQRGDCPQSISDRVLTYNVNKYINIAIDGKLLDRHFLNNDHLFSFYFPEMRSLGKYWDTPSYKIGLRALLEGSGKAAEWIYGLRIDRSMEKEAWLDIKKSPEIYQSALNRLMTTIAKSSLLEYLQLLVVLVDICINPWIDQDTWPFIWGHSKGRDVLPGFRFESLLQLLKKYPDIEATSKEVIASKLAEIVAENYGWAPPSEITKQLVMLTGKAKITFNNSEPWNPLETIQNVLQVKMSDPFAYVPPVNADAINSSETFPPILLTTGVDRGPETKVLLTYLMRSFQESFMNDIVNVGLLKCPIASNTWIKATWRQKGWCRFGENCPFLAGHASKDWTGSSKCKFYDAVIQGFLCNNSNRIRFL
jgi:hypothetical protein